MRSYGTESLTDASPAQVFAEPLTLSEVKAFLELPERSPTDSAEDAMLDGFISAARMEAERGQGRELIRKQYDLSLDYFGQGFGYRDYSHVQRYLEGNPLEIQLRVPLVSVDLVQYRDSAGVTHALVEDTDYLVDLARGLLMPAYGKTWPSFTPWPSSAVLIQYTAGYASSHPVWLNSGTRLKLGMKELITHWFSHRLPFDTLQGTTSTEFPYAVTAMFSAGARPRVR